MGDGNIFYKYISARAEIWPKDPEAIKYTGKPGVRKLPGSILPFVIILKPPWLFKFPVSASRTAG